MKRTLLLLAVLLGATSAFALEKDAEGYYLLGSADDWRAFAALVNDDPTVNARMIDNIDLGDDQTHIGSMTQDRGPYYQGIFDGQGFTLTVAYVGSTRQIVAPFPQTKNATIKNLHLDGSINSVFAFIGVVGRCVGGLDVISNVWNSADLTCNSGDWNWVGGIVGGSDSRANITISDCLFTGNITASNNYTGCFLGYQYNGGSTIVNCLSTGTLNTGQFTATSFSNCYVSQFPSAIPAGMQCTPEQLADGTVAAALQADREETVWTQDPETNMPMLAVFKYELRQDADGYYLLDSRRAWDTFAALVDENPAVNARMTRPIDLGNDQTCIGSTAPDGYYSGVFDGQGYTLTVAYESDHNIAPFMQINGATIKDVEIEGSIKAAHGPVGGVASIALGHETISGVLVSADISCAATARDWANVGALVGSTAQNGGNAYVTITDCLFTGTCTTGGTQNGWLMGFDYYLNRATTTNSLSVGTFDYPWAQCYFPGTTTNCFTKQFSHNIPAEMQCTDEQLADGTITAALQAGRTRKIWVQDDATRQPMLRRFIRVDGDLNRDGIVDVDDVNILVNIILGIVPAEDYGTRANVDHQGGVDVGDINAVIAIITGK